MKATREKPSELNFEDLIGAAGAFGKYQRCFFGILAFAAVIASAAFLCNTMLTDGLPEYKCAVADDTKEVILKACNASWNEHQDNLMVPWNKKSKFYDHCYRFILTSADDIASNCSYWFAELENTSVPHQLQHNFNTSKCSRWEYTSKNFHSSVAMEFDLVCDNAWKAQLGSFGLMTGVLIGAFVFGYCSDRFGRKPTMATAALVLCVSELASTFVNHYVIYCLLILFVGAGYVGTAMVGFIASMEIVTERHRVVLSICLMCAFSVSQMLLALIGYLIMDWRTVGQISSSIVLLLLPIYIKFGFESPRWLSANSKHEEADDVIRKVAKTNSRENKLIILKEKNRQDLNFEEETFIKTKEDGDSRHYILDLFTNSTLRKLTLILSYNWFASTIIFYGLSLTATLLGGNVFLNLFFSGLVEIPANIAIAYLMSAWGRRPVIILFHIIPSIALLFMLFTTGTYWANLVLFLIAKSGTTGAFSGIYLYTTELYPTPNRGIGLGLCSGFARFGGVFAVAVLLLSSISIALPYVTFGILGLLAGILVGLLPETKSVGFPETSKECESMYKNRTTSLKSQCLPCFFND